MDRIAFSFSLFGKTISITKYALCVTGGMIAALCLLIYLMHKKRDEYTLDDSLEVFLFAIPFAIIFARLGFSLPRINTFESFWDFWNITNGGLTIVAGVPGGAIGLLIYCKIRKKSPFRLFDLLVPCLLVGQILGRWGNFFNEELYGLEITNPALQFFPFGVQIDGVWHCANFFYEGFFNSIALIVVLVVMFKFKGKLKVGTITIGYIVWYGLLRGLLEFVKVDKMMLGSLGLIQIVCFIVAVIGIVVMILLQKGIISFESEKMRKAHFITTSVADEIMSNNSKYSVDKEITIKDEADCEDEATRKEVDINE